MTDHKGHLPESMTWYDLGSQFGLEAPDLERAEKSKEYERAAIARKAQDIWRAYKKQKEKLSLTKEVYKNSKLLFETYKKIPEEEIDFDIEKYEIERFTTNPHGGMWKKYIRKSDFYTEKHINNIRKILTKKIEAIEYNIPNKQVEDIGVFIYTSDKHIGAKTKKDSIYKNSYDKNEIRKRIVIQVLSEISKNVGESFVDSLFIMDLGDALDGDQGKTTRGLKGNSSHTLPQLYSGTEQHDIYLELHKELFDEIVNRKFAKNIFFIATANSNHGGSLEYGAMRNLETYLNLKYPFIKTFINKYPYNHFIWGNHAIIFGHGKDDEDMKKGLPLVLDFKTENYFNNYIEENKLNNYIITVVSGDLHQSAETYGKKFRYKKVLSQYGSSKWIHTNFGFTKAGISSEKINKHKREIVKRDFFFDKIDTSNTGINL